MIAELRKIYFYNNDGIFCHRYEPEILVKTWWNFNSTEKNCFIIVFDKTKQIHLENLIGVPFYIDDSTNVYTIVRTYNTHLKLVKFEEKD